MLTQRQGTLVAALLAAAAGPSLQANEPPSHRTSVPQATDTISVMTYNVHGLPWPIVEPRGDELAEIGQRLAQLRRSGRAPSVVAIQEAFTRDAAAIGRASGYPYVIYGPSDRGPFETASPAAFRGLANGDTWWKGERLGKWEGSGLMLLSYYPVVRVRRIAYSRDACAGYDCLAAKGAMLATLTLPDRRQVEVATTHMNSRRASGVEDARSDLAWAAQAAELERFIKANRNPRLPLVLAGDFNVGADPRRRQGMAKLARNLDPAIINGLDQLRRNGEAIGIDAATELRRGKDWELAMRGTTMTLQPKAVAVPFGSRAGAPLSDHLGYSVLYAFRKSVAS